MWNREPFPRIRIWTLLPSGRDTYINDTCTALPPDQVQAFHAQLNSLKPLIQFTLESEKNSTLPFLGTEFTHHPDGSLPTRVYRKPTHTDKYLDFQSHHPIVYKFAALHLRAKHLCTFITDRTEEELYVRDILTWSSALPFTPPA